MRKLLFVFLSVAAFATSCKKDDSSPLKRVQSVVYSSGSSDMYEYNSQGKISKITSGTYITMFEYFGSTIHLLRTYTNGSSDGGSANVLSLNKRGYVDSVAEDQYLSTFEYNAEGYLLKQTVLDVRSSYSSTTSCTSYVYENGNLKTETYTSIDYYSGKVSSTTNYTNNYEYYTDRTNTLIYGYNFFGKPNKNLTKKLTQTYSYVSSDYPSESSNSISVTDYVYEYQDNYAIKQTSTSTTTLGTGSSSSSTAWIAYTYK